MKKSNANRILNKAKERRMGRLNDGLSSDIQNTSCGSCVHWTRYRGITTNMSHCRHLGQVTWSNDICDAFEKQGE